MSGRNRRPALEILVWFLAGLSAGMDFNSCKGSATLACWAGYSRPAVYDPSLFGARVSVGINGLSVVSFGRAFSVAINRASTYFFQ